MKFAFAAVALAVTSLCAVGQTPPAPPDKPAEPKAPAPDPKTIDDAKTLLVDVAKAYRDAKTITDTTKVEFKAPDGTQAHVFKIVIGTGSDASLNFDEFTFTAVDDKVYLVREGVDDKYYTSKLEGSLAQMIDQITGGGLPVPPQLVLRGNTDQEVEPARLTMGILEDAEIAGKRTGKAEDGSAVDEIVLKSENGSGVVQVNPKSKLLQTVKLTLSSRMEGAGDVLVTITMNPQVRDSLATPIAFSAGARKAVDSIEELEPEPVQEGQAAPDFTLTDLNGDSVTLSKLKGSAVVLDFWATWCGPCKMALPKVQEFAKWAETSGQPIKVYAVDVWEHNSDAEQTKQKVGEFWKSKGYTFPTLLDLDQAVVKKYGFQSIPTTVIVGPDGKIFRIHTGYSPDIVDALKSDVGDALKSPG